MATRQFIYVYMFFLVQLGTLKNPSWIGSANFRKKMIISSEPWTPFLFLGTTVITAKYEWENQAGQYWTKQL